VLEEELNEKLNEEGLDLNEPSYTPVPYTPLFIAFMNDHYQVGGANHSTLQYTTVHYHTSFTEAYCTCSTMDLFCNSTIIYATLQ